MTDTHIIDGKARSAALREKIAGEVAEFRAKTGVAPELAVVLVGENPASQVYVRNKVKACKEAGIRSNERLLPADIDQASLIEEIRALNRSSATHGILVQLPLPKHIDERAVLEAVDPAKDVDGFHPINAGKLWAGQPDALVPCTPLGCLMLIKEGLGFRDSALGNANPQSPIPNPLQGLHALIIGRSNIVGKPMAALLLREDCTVTLAHSRTLDLIAEAQRADIIVAAVGRPLMVKGNWLKPGAVVIDVGINRITLPDGKEKLLGDVAYDECLGLASAITPVPGGVGPMTIACLLQNTLTAAQAQARLSSRTSEQ